MGVFDTMLVEHGRPVTLELHLQRLAESLNEVYGATLPPTLAAGVYMAAAEATSPDGRARLRIDVDADGGVRITLSPTGPPPLGGGGARAVRPARRARRPQRGLLGF